MTRESLKNLTIDKIEIGEKKYQKSSSHGRIWGAISAFSGIGEKVNLIHFGNTSKEGTGKKYYI